MLLHKLQTSFLGKGLQGQQIEAFLIDGLKLQCLFIRCFLFVLKNINYQAFMLYNIFPLLFQTGVKAHSSKPLLPGLFFFVFQKLRKRMAKAKKMKCKS